MMKRVAALAIVIALAFTSVAYGAQGASAQFGHPGHGTASGVHAEEGLSIEKSDVTFGKLTAKYKYWASRSSYAFHRTGCRYIKQIKSSNLVGFKTRSAAIKAGKTPCKVCRP